MTDIVDLYDVAYSWGWAHPTLRKTVYLCYKTPDFVSNARRFHASAEFSETCALLGRLGHPPSNAGRLLDIGCGNGVACYALARSGYRVTGVDSSAGQLAGIRAAEKIVGLDGSHFEVRQVTPGPLEFPDESFDVVWMREVLHHITDLVPFLLEVKRILKPDGVLCCLRDTVIWNDEQRANFFRNHPFFHITHDEGCYYLDEYRQAFKIAGLRMEQEVNPLESVINTYPSDPIPGALYDPAVSMANPGRYDLFSFFVRKPAMSPVMPVPWPTEGGAVESAPLQKASADSAPETAPLAACQDLAVYWTPEMAIMLEVWGDDNVWNEIQFLLAGCEGRILDIACGTGNAIAMLSRFRHLEIHGCDISDFLIGKAIERGLRKDLLRVCDATATGYADQSFRHAYSIGSLEHFTEDGIVEFLTETNRITRHSSFHMVPVSRSGRDEGWVRSSQGYFNNSTAWWQERFSSVFTAVHSLDSAWSDSISTGKWFVCTNTPVPAHTHDAVLAHTGACCRPAGDQLRKNTMLGSVMTVEGEHYGPVILTPQILASIAASPETMEEILLFHEQLATDKYVRYVDTYYWEGLRRFGRHWRFMDISTVLYAAAKVLQPRNYLEIGVRRGRSISMVVRACPSVKIAAFDLWVSNYAGMENPGPDFVREELIRQGHTGTISFFNGDSHQTIPKVFAASPDVLFDMITVDGDHSEAGAYDDLCNVIPRLAVGGVLVFDDVAHPLHPELVGVWRKALARFPALVAYEFTESGFGVAFAIRSR
ncbi:unannotated protein [freshwater metagenome]|uniref:Unannotated protein n=1 Tax=freshwater metagenome TaxID=449393 RepID=A0A6J6UU10_9ZZZZ|nr:methyltransferase domain-containing protein [Actinomycetota bacterium]